MLNANGPGFAGLYAGDIVEWQPREWESAHRCAVLPLLVFADHVQVRFGTFGATVDVSNFVRLVRRGKRHIAADVADAAPFGNCPRTLALYKPGEPMRGVNHHYAYTGAMPCTGTLRCTLCGELAP